MPFMTLLRAPARLGVFVALAVGVLGGVGLATFERRWTGRPRIAWLSAIAVFSLASASVGPLQLETAAPPSRAVMALQRIQGGPVAEFPFFNRGRNFHQHTIYMLASTFHWHPLINGYSDFLPPDVGAALPDLVRFPSPESVAFLRGRGTKYVVVHWELYSPSETEALRARIRELHDVLRPMVDDADASLFELIG
jgi:hypothetical protein